MNAVRLFCGMGSGLNIYGTKLMKIPQCGGKPVQLMISRVYSQGERETVWKTARSRRKILSEAATQPSVGTAISIGQGFAAGSAIVGLGGLAYYGLGFSNQAGILENSILWPQYVRDRVRSTYLYFGSSLIVTAAAAVAALRVPALRRFFAKDSYVAIGVNFALVIGSGLALQALEYAPTLNAKHLAWIAHSAFLGGILSPMCILGGPIVTKALCYTAGIVGGLTTMAVCAPNDKFLNYGGPLAMCLGFVFISSIGSMFLPPTSAIGSGLMMISLYGGLVLFSGLMLYDTQRIVHNAETYPLYAAKPYDPINAAHSIYMDTLNIFIRLVAIFSGNAGNQKR